MKLTKKQKKKIEDKFWYALSYGQDMLTKDLELYAADCAADIIKFLEEEERIMRYDSVKT